MSILTVIMAVVVERETRKIQSMDFSRTCGWILQWRSGHVVHDPGACQIDAWSYPITYIWSGRSTKRGLQPCQGS